MQFSEFSNILEQLENTDSRLDMMYQLAELYKDLETEEITVASYLMQGSLVPAYLSLEFQLSAIMVIRALAYLHADYSVAQAQTSNQSNQLQLTGLFDTPITTTESSVEQLTKLYKRVGDIGVVAYEVMTVWDSWAVENGLPVNKQNTIVETYNQLVVIAQESGAGSQEKKLQKLVQLFKTADPVSAKFIARIVVGKLRLGFSAMTILDALSWVVTQSKNHRNILELAYQKRADVGELAQTYLRIAKEVGQEPVEGTAYLQLVTQRLAEKYEVMVGVPVVPALCQRLNSAKEIIEKMDVVIAEPKYDGLRVQIHYSKKGFADGQYVRAFTRNLEEVTHMFPELLQLHEVLKVQECILDCEAIGYDPQTDVLLPFQETITRKRKHEVGKASEKVPIRFYVFDVLSSGGVSFLDKKLQERKDYLEALFIDNRTIKVAEYITTSDPNELHEYHEQKLLEGLEGAVIKQINSVYQSGRKGWSWVKIKESEGSSGKLKDTLDLVVMGYYVGRGKRSKFGVGAFLVGVLNDASEIKTIAKIGTGLTDEQFRELKQRANGLATKEQPKEYEVPKVLVPDGWMLPELVVEIAADEITKSPTHSAGVALRFPRLLAFRDDKSWTDATTIKELKNF